MTKAKTKSAASRPDSGVQVLDRAAEILRVLTTAPAGLTQAEVAVRLGLARSTTHRLLSALASRSLVEEFGSAGRYRLGSEILRMADAARASLITEAHPLLEELSREIDETVDLAILERGALTFVDQVVAPQRLRAVSAVGLSFPLHSTANGKALLAHLSHAELERLLPEKLPAQTPNTIRTLPQLKKELARVRQRGFAVDEEEHSLGICAIGVALGPTPLGQAALSIPMPTQRFKEKRDRAAETLMHASKRFTNLLRG